MNDWFADGRIIVIILVIIGCEFVLLLLCTRQKPGLMRTLTPTLAAGGLLAMALGARHVATDWRISALLLAFAGLAHLVDLVLRWRYHAPS